MPLTVAELRLAWEQDRIPMDMLIGIIGATITSLGHKAAQRAMREHETYLAAYAALDKGDVMEAWVQATRLWQLVQRLRGLHDDMAELLDLSEQWRNDNEFIVRGLRPTNSTP